jgi:acyl carrier protein
MDARALIAEVLRQTAIAVADDTPLADIDGWDSLKGVRLVLRLEEISGRELSESQIEGLQAVKDVEDLLKADI